MLFFFLNLRLAGRIYIFQQIVSNKDPTSLLRALSHSPVRVKRIIRPRAGKMLKQSDKSSDHKLNISSPSSCTSSVLLTKCLWGQDVLKQYLQSRNYFNSADSPHGDGRKGAAFTTRRILRTSRRPAKVHYACATGRFEWQSHCGKYLKNIFILHFHSITLHRGSGIGVPK